MNIKQLFFITILFLTNIPSIPLFARIGCRDNSWHMQKKYDAKEDHAVECYCPCPATTSRCFDCSHYHTPQPWEIIQNDAQVTTQTPQSSLRSRDPLVVLKTLVNRYQKIKKKNVQG